MNWKSFAIGAGAGGGGVGLVWIIKAVITKFRTPKPQPAQQPAQQDKAQAPVGS